MRIQTALWASGLLLVGSLTYANTDPKLVDAVKRADMDTVRALTRQRADINERAGDGSTALHWAAHLDDMNAVDLLLTARADVNVANDLGVTPLFAAVPNGPRVVERLLAAGANPNAVLPSGETVVMNAARTGQADVVRALLRKGADANARDHERGQTALMWAAAQQHHDVVAVLLEYKADLQARSKPYTRRVLVGARRGVKPPVGNGRTASDEQTGVVETTLGGSTAFLLAARVGDLASGKLLLSAGADVNDTLPNGTSALVLAAHGGHEDFALMLVAQGADPDAAGAGYSALHAAVLRSQRRLAEALLAHGANPNAPLKRGTAVRYVSVDYAFPTNLVDATPVWLAAKYREPELLQVLVNGGGEPRFALDDGSNAIVAALDSPIQQPGFYYTDVRNRYLSPTEQSNLSPEKEERRLLETITFLVEKGADVNAKNAAGDTPLHLAAARGYNSVVRFLVEKGADVNAKNQTDKSPVEMTNRPGMLQQPATGDLLRSLGARQS